MVKRYTILDSEGRLSEGISSSPMGNNSVELDVEQGHEVLYNPYIYRFIDGKLVRDNVKALNDKKSMRKEDLKSVCGQKIKVGFLASNGNFYRYNQEDQLNIMNKYIEMTADPSITEIVHNSENNGEITHTREEWELVYKESSDHKRKCLDHYEKLKDYIDKLQTVNEVEAVTWETNINAI